MTWLAFKRSRTFGTPTFLRVAAELLSGMLHLHERNVAHRDLEPENVLLATGTRQVKEADFGLAKMNRSTVTRGVGTPPTCRPKCSPTRTAQRRPESSPWTCLYLLPAREQEEDYSGNRTATTSGEHRKH